MKIIITGANGFIGRELKNLAENLGYDLTLVSKSANFLNGIKNFQNLFDINNGEVFDILIHCAAATPLNTKTDDILFINQEIHNELCDFLKRIKVNHVFYLSTMAVYGKINSRKINELSPINNPDKYGLSKLIGENSLRDCCNDLGNKLSILRLPGVVGKEMPLTFFRRLYFSIVNSQEIKIRSRDSFFNNSVLCNDIFLTILNLNIKQKEELILLNHHSEDTINLGKLILYFSEVVGKKCFYLESDECNPPFIISNKNYENLLIKSKIKNMITHFHSSHSK